MLLFAFFLSAVGVYSLWLYNRLRTRKNQVAFAKSTVDALLKKRHDLIPNLNAVVRGYAQHEQIVIETVLGARASTNYQDRLAALVEHYPELQADAQFLRLQDSLFELESQIAASRRFVNAALNDYNNAVETLPSSLMARLLNYSPLPYRAEHSR